MRNNIVDDRLPAIEFQSLIALGEKLACQVASILAIIKNYPH
jgi:DNA-binding Xre family transcriptional regulator